MPNSENITKCNPIFIISSERSGSNLLRRRIAEHQYEAFGPQPLHILKILYYAQPFYGDLSQKDNLAEFINDCLGLAYKHFSPWTKKITVDEIIEWHKNEWHGSEYSVVSIMHSMNTIYARKNGYKTYICKDNNIFNFCYPIASELPGSKFIYLYRDPRDVVASQLSRPTQSRSVVKLANLWKDEQIKSIQAINSPILKNNKVVSVSYEYFVFNEEKALKEICMKLDLQYTSKPGTNNIYSDEKTDIHEWKNLNKPTSTSSVGRYKNRLNKQQLKIIENIAWHQMRYLGYKADNKKRHKINRLFLVGEQEIMKFYSTIRSCFVKNRLTDGQKLQKIYIKKIQKKYL